MNLLILRGAITRWHDSHDYLLGDYILFMDYPIGTLVYDPFCNPYIVKGTWYNATNGNVKYYFVEDANSFFFFAPNAQCNVVGIDVLGRQITLPMPDCNCKGVLRLIPDTSLTTKPKPTKDNTQANWRGQ